MDTDQDISAQLAAITLRIAFAVWHLHAGTPTEPLGTVAVDVSAKAKTKPFTEPGVTGAEPKLRFRALLRERDRLVHAIAGQAIELRHAMGNLAETLAHQRTTMTRE